MVAQREATHEYERAHQERYHQRRPNGDKPSCPYCPTKTVETDIANLPNMYRPTRPSNCLPMERFLLPTPAEDSLAYMARHEMRRTRTACGSLEAVPSRHAAAVAVAAGPSAAIDLSLLTMDFEEEFDTRSAEIAAKLQMEYRRTRALSPNQHTVVRPPTNRQKDGSGFTKDKRRK